ncbi:MAG: ABC transporter ATP-binding protein [Kofleriaceae bacterium]|nr:MAG: ABC transporter ATP-binding protein [Kofleriaceae bacterium]MBZ0231517.1 ABC transporter ATP-binding protein [Kofleriaceae bacterium]
MSADPVIQLESVRKSYGEGAGKTEVLRGVSLSVPRGELIALVGQSGSGKSTLLNIVGGLDKADGGTVRVLGHDYRQTGEQELARLRNAKIGFVFQAFNLLDHLTCLGNVTLPASFAPGAKDVEKRGREALGRVGLGDYAQRRPSELSGGQKQRVAIARALFNRPELLLCDEPTGNLDSATGHEVIEFFKELNQKDGVTLMIVTHERRMSTIAQRVITMQDGAIVEGDLAGNDNGGPA